MKRFAASLLLLALTPVPIGPMRVPPEPALPELTAESWILYDTATDTVVAAHNEHEERAMASVTKVMTALVVRDHADLDERVRVSPAAADVGESEIGLVAGEAWSVRDLLAAILIRSGNDAAVALAQHVGGTISGFADLMNAKAAEMGLKDSHFMNPHGLDEEGHYTSAYDLARIADAALQDPVLAQLVRTKVVRFKPAPNGADRIAHNTNHLLGRYPGVIGMKTGYTSKAGRVLISVIDTDGHTLIAVVMGSEDHFADSRELLDYAAKRYNIRDRFLLGMREQQGGGGVVGQSLDPITDSILKTLAPLPTGAEEQTPFGETPGAEAIVAGLRSRLPVTLGGQG
jgi:D-alanyl-D-alanine carboxypeptidase (penicillin-binding protein 5/6)